MNDVDSYVQWLEGEVATLRSKLETAKEEVERAQLNETLACRRIGELMIDIAKLKETIQ